MNTTTPNFAASLATLKVEYVHLRAERRALIQKLGDLEIEAMRMEWRIFDIEKALQNDAA